MARQTRPGAAQHTVGFHNFNLRIFNLRVSNPNKLIVDVLFDTMSDFNVPGSRPNKNTMKFRKSTVCLCQLLFEESHWICYDSVNCFTFYSHNSQSIAKSAVVFHMSALSVCLCLLCLGVTVLIHYNNSRSYVTLTINYNNSSLLLFELCLCVTVLIVIPSYTILFYTVL